MPRPRYDDDEYDDEYDDGGYVEPHRGTTILVLGLLSLVVCGLLGPVAWVMGSSDLKKMAAGQMDRSGRGETQAGYICGMIATILMGLGLVLAIVWIAFVAAMVGGGAAGGGKVGP